MINKSIIIILIIAALLVGGSIGYAMGYNAGLGWAVKQAYYILDKQGIKLSIDPTLVAVGLAAYKIRIEDCISAYYASNITKWS